MLVGGPFEEMKDRLNTGTLAYRDDIKLNCILGLTKGPASIQTKGNIQMQLPEHVNTHYSCYRPQSTHPHRASVACHAYLR